MRRQQVVVDRGSAGQSAIRSQEELHEFLGEYLTAKFWTLSAGYRMLYGIAPESSQDIALRIATKLLQAQQEPLLVRFIGPRGMTFPRNRGDIIPLRYEWRERWPEHWSCMWKDWVYDPLLDYRATLGNFAAQAFWNGAEVAETIPTEQVRVMVQQRRQQRREAARLRRLALSS